MADQSISQLTAGVPLATDIIPYTDLVAGVTKKSLVSNVMGLTRGAGDFNTFTDNAIPLYSDILLTEDSNASYVKKKVSLTNLYLKFYPDLITQRVITTTDDSTAVIDVTVTDVYELTAMANNTTFSTTGTPIDGQNIIIRFKDAGIAKTLTWDAIFVPIGVVLPTTTVAGKWHYVGVQYNSNAVKFHVLAVAVQA